MKWNNSEVNDNTSSGVDGLFLKLTELTKQSYSCSLHGLRFLMLLWLSGLGWNFAMKSLSPIIRHPRLSSRQVFEN